MYLAHELGYVRMTLDLCARRNRGLAVLCSLVGFDT